MDTCRHYFSLKSPKILFNYYFNSFYLPIKYSPFKQKASVVKFNEACITTVTKYT